MNRRSNSNEITSVESELTCFYSSDAVNDLPSQKSALRSQPSFKKRSVSFSAAAEEIVSGASRSTRASTHESISIYPEGVFGSDDIEDAPKQDSVAVKLYKFFTAEPEDDTVMEIADYSNNHDDDDDDDDDDYDNDMNKKWMFIAKESLDGTDEVQIRKSQSRSRDLDNDSEEKPIWTTKDGWLPLDDHSSDKDSEEATDTIWATIGSYHLDGHSSWTATKKTTTPPKPKGVNGRPNLPTRVRVRTAGMIEYFAKFPQVGVDELDEMDEFDDVPPLEVPYCPFGWLTSITSWSNLLAGCC